MEVFTLSLIILLALAMVGLLTFAVLFFQIRSKTVRLTSEIKQREVFAHFPDHNPHPIMRFSHKGQLLFSNAASQTLLGYWHLSPNGFLPSDWVHLLRKALVENKPQDIDVEHLGHAYLITLMPIGKEKVVNCYAIDITEKQTAMEEAHKKTLYDPITHLPNRVLTLDYLRLHAERLKPKHRMFVLMVTISDLSEIASTVDDSVMNQLLKTVANHLEELTSQEATLGKPSERSFVIIESELFNHGQAINLAQKILSWFSEPLFIDGKSILPKITIGISAYPDDSQNPEIIMRNAKLAQSRVIAQNKQVLFYQSDMDEQVQAKRNILVDLHKALKNHELMLYYQPQWSVSKNQFIGAEALLRWRHPDRGFISPFFFVTAAEESGLIIPISDWVLKTACKDAATLKAKNIPFKTAINLSAVQFMQDDMIDKILLNIENHKLSADLLELEITEGVVIQDVGKAIEKMHALRTAGFSLAIDDFGTGYSSLSYLQQFPVQKLKIDRAFIKDMDSSSQSFNMTRGIIELGHSLNLNLVAEGVENPKQVELLQKLNCDIIQGYYYSKPVPFEEMLDLISGQTKF